MKESDVIVIRTRRSELSPFAETESLEFMVLGLIDVLVTARIENRRACASEGEGVSHPTTATTATMQNGLEMMIGGTGIPDLRIAAKMDGMRGFGADMGRRGGGG